MDMLWLKVKLHDFEADDCVFHHVFKRYPCMPCGTFGDIILRGTRVIATGITLFFGLHVWLLSQDFCLEGMDP